MNNKSIIGKIFIHIGEQLCDPDSELCRSIVLSNEQIEACLRLVKIASAPQTHRLSINELAYRYNVTDRTIRNWVKDGAIPKAREDFEGKHFWLSHEMHEVDDYLVRKRYIAKEDIRSIDYRLKDLLDRYKW